MRGSDFNDRALYLGAAILATAMLLGLISAATTRGAHPLDTAPDAIAPSTRVMVTAPDRVAGWPAGVETVPPWWAPPHDGTILRRSSQRPFRPPGGGTVTQESSADGWTTWTLVHGEPAVAEAGRDERIPIADHLRDAEVEILHEDGSARRCGRWLFGRWHCGPGDWNYVGMTDLRIRNRDENCIWAHPTDEGTLVIRFPDVPAGSTFMGRHGLADVAADNTEGADVIMRVLQDGEEIGIQVQTPRRGLTSFRTPMNPVEGGTTTLEFRISAEDVGQRHFCFNGEISTREGRPNRTPRTRRERADDAIEGSGEATGSGDAADADLLRPSPSRITPSPRAIHAMDLDEIEVGDGADEDEGGDQQTDDDDRPRRRHRDRDDDHDRDDDDHDHGGDDE